MCIGDDKMQFVSIMKNNVLLIFNTNLALRSKCTMVDVRSCLYALVKHIGGSRLGLPRRNCCI